MIFKTCPLCGCALDPDERCDCQEETEEAAPAATGTTSPSRYNPSLPAEQLRVKNVRGCRNVE